MTRILVERSLPPYDSYNVARTRGLYNVSERDDRSFSIEVDLPIDRDDWQIGMVVGPSGSGKSSILRDLESQKWLEWTASWGDNPIVDELGVEGGYPYEKITAALAAVGLGSVPSWLRPRSVLSMGEGFRADMAQLLLEGQDHVMIDEFTSVLDRQVAQVAAGAFAKSWRRGKGQIILFTCHYDVLDWVQPDWWVDTAEAGGGALPGDERQVVPARQGSFPAASNRARHRGDWVGTLEC